MLCQAFESRDVTRSQLVPHGAEAGEVVGKALADLVDQMGPAFQEAGAAAVVLEDVHDNAGVVQVVLFLVVAHAVATVNLHFLHCIRAARKKCLGTFA